MISESPFLTSILPGSKQPDIVERRIVVLDVSGKTVWKRRIPSKRDMGVAS
jgi:hypothetical protein